MWNSRHNSPHWWHIKQKKPEKWYDFWSATITLFFLRSPSELTIGHFLRSSHILRFRYFICSNKLNLPLLVKGFQVNISTKITVRSSEITKDHSKIFGILMQKWLYIWVNCWMHFLHKNSRSKWFLNEPIRWFIENYLIVLILK